MSPPFPMRRSAPLWAAMVSVLLSPHALGAATAFLSPTARPPLAAARLFSSGPASPDDLDALRVPDLKDRLRSLGLKVGGRKADLVERLRSASGGPVVVGGGGAPALEEVSVSTSVSSYDAVPPGAIVILACKS